MKADELISTPFDFNKIKLFESDNVPEGIIVLVDADGKPFYACPIHRFADPETINEHGRALDGVLMNPTDAKSLKEFLIEKTKSLN